MRNTRRQGGRFNRFAADAQPPHRERMALILTTPELMAHSVLRYGDWRRVIAEYVARRTDTAPDNLAPRMVGQVSLALALTAYEVWPRGRAGLPARGAEREYVRAGPPPRPHALIGPAVAGAPSIEESAPRALPHQLRSSDGETIDSPWTI